MRTLLAKMEREQQVMEEASVSMRAECDELRVRHSEAMDKLNEQRAKVASLRMRAAAALDEVKLTREKMAKSSDAPVSILTDGANCYTAGGDVTKPESARILLHYSKMFLMQEYSVRACSALCGRGVSATW